MKSILVTLAELRHGGLVNEATHALQQVLLAVAATGKRGKVKIELDIKPVDSRGMVEPAINVLGSVTPTIPVPDADGTLMFVAADGEPTMTPTRRQPDLPGVTFINQEKARHE